MPSNSRLIESLYERLRSEELNASNAFEFVQDLCRVVNDDPTGEVSHDLVLRSLDQRANLLGCGEVLDGLIRRLGLFPYLNPDKLSLPDLLAYEAHRPFDFSDDIVFHRAQAHVYHRLMAGENVALSAPTSFGKSLIIDAIIASGRYSDVAIVVPTLALIDETRRRLAKRFRNTYKIITHANQSREERNLFILTQERVLDVSDWSFLKFFVIDEFYKLSPRDESDERSGLLNQALYRLAKSGAQFYMLGPNIEGITNQNHLRIELRFVSEPNYHTVATQIHRVDSQGDARLALVELCQRLDSPTIIFCRSPNRAAEVARALASAGLSPSAVDTEASKWISETYHPDWHVAEAFRAGIGVHHGRIPRALGQFIVRSFNDGSLRFLVCTSTLIEGVNTKARNIVVFDNQINRQRIDMFTFNNIKGRSGRMFEYFVGHVFVFHDDPQQELPFVDVPALSQSDAASSSLLIQMDEADLTESSRGKLQRFTEQQTLSFDVIRQNRGVDPEVQIEVARFIGSQAENYKANLNWSGVPRFPELEQICQLMFTQFNARGLGGGSARSARQLAVMILGLQDRSTTRELIERQRTYSASFDEAVEMVLNFQRLWATFHFPRLLRAIGNIQQDVLTREGLPAGSYDWFASQVENMFLEPGLVAAEEFGVPIDTARRISPQLTGDGSIDETVRRLRNLQVEELNISDFEKSLVQDAVDSF